MALRYGATTEREPEFQEVYFNKYLTGTLLAPLLRAFFYSFGIVLYTPLFVALAIISVAVPVALLLGWHKVPPGMAAPQASGNTKELLGLALIALVGLVVVAVCMRSLFKVWATFFRIVRSHFYVTAARPLASVEGEPTFSGGRRSGYRSGGKWPDKLEIEGIKFDLKHCWRAGELPELASKNFVGVESSPAGLAYGFTLKVSLRVWYVPSTGVLVRAEMRPLGQTDLAGKAETLKRELAVWYERRATELSEKDKVKTRRLIDELESLKARLAPGIAAHTRPDAEDRLAQLEQWLSFLDINNGRCSAVKYDLS